MVGRHHQLSGHEFEQGPGDSDGQGGLACGSACGHKGSDTTERLNRNETTDPASRESDQTAASARPGGIRRGELPLNAADGWSPRPQ